MSPLNTVLDDSIGCALWFAARGVGRLRTTSGNSNLKQDSEANVEDETYTSRAKVQQLLAVTQKCQSECMFIPKQRSSKIAKFRKIESIVAFRALQPGIVLVAIPAEIKNWKLRKWIQTQPVFMQLLLYLSAYKLLWKRRLSDSHFSNNSSYTALKFSEHFSVIYYTRERCSSITIPSLQVGLVFRTITLKFQLLCCSFIHLLTKSEMTESYREMQNSSFSFFFFASEMLAHVVFSYSFSFFVCFFFLHETLALYPDFNSYHTSSVQSNHVTHNYRYPHFIRFCWLVWGLMNNWEDMPDTGHASSEGLRLKLHQSRVVRKALELILASVAWSNEEYYYTSGLQWKLWLVKSIQPVYNSVWSWHDNPMSEADIGLSCPVQGLPSF